jgi:hypothetical protein
MFTTDFTRTALSAAGALLLTTTMVGAAVGPARVAETSPVVYAEAAVELSGEANA